MKNRMKNLNFIKGVYFFKFYFDGSIWCSGFIYIYYLCGIGKCAARKLDMYKKEGGLYEKIKRLFSYDSYSCHLFCSKPVFQKAG